MTTRTLGLILLAYLVASAITMAAYGLDKFMAARGPGAGRRPWRVSERTLHTLELLGGWPGALVAQQLFRHKRAKRRYMLWFWLIVAAHAGGWLAWAIISHRAAPAAWG